MVATPHPALSQRPFSVWFSAECEYGTILAKLTRTLGALARSVLLPRLPRAPSSATCASFDRPSSRDCPKFATELTPSSRSCRAGRLPRSEIRPRVGVHAPPPT